MQIAAGYDYTLALRADGTVVEWGDCYPGDCSVPPGLTGVTQIAAGGEHCLARKSDGTVVAWGFNSSGQCNVPSGLSNVIEVAAGWQHSLALKADGTVIGWGDNFYGQRNIPSNLFGVRHIIAGGNNSFALVDAPAIVVSRKTHGVAGDFDIELPLTGTPHTECRSGGPTNDHRLVVTYAADVSVTGSPQAAVTSGAGLVGRGGIGNGGMVEINGNTVTIPLTNVVNAQTINVTLFGVNGGGNLVIPMGVLEGDTNGNGAVNAADVSFVKAHLGQGVSSSNFRADVNANGLIDASDICVTKSLVGSGLP